MVFRIEVADKELPNLPDARGNRFKDRILSDFGIKVEGVKVVDVYNIECESGEFSKEEQESVRKELFEDPIVQVSALDSIADKEFDHLIQIGFYPGVTDNIGNTAAEAIRDLTGKESQAYSAEQYLIKGNLSPEEVMKIAGIKSNPIINVTTIMDKEEYTEKGIPITIPKVTMDANDSVAYIDLEVSDEELIDIGKRGIKDPETGKPRGPLAAGLEEMKALRNYARGLGRDLSDVEIEDVCQTWSEHCKHTIFNSKLVDEEGNLVVNSLFDDYLKKATQEIREKRVMHGRDDFCVSVFEDNAGVIKFTEDYNLVFKVETHNSPSALDPYGGALTGIVGVNRDPFGTGLGAWLFFNCYGFCTGDPEYKGDLIYKNKDRKNPILHPKIILEGIREGVEHGGNKSGIPTGIGFLTFDERYMGKPLVYCGTAGIMPTKIFGNPSHEKKAQPGDYIIMVGGRVGADGIHGATFSSEGMDEGSPRSAVQIGDPITQKKMHDAIEEIIINDHRSMSWSSQTDNGAGGLSCSVGEMAKESGGYDMDLEKVPLKYQGLMPNETKISESQERMTFSIPPENADAFIEHMASRGVEATIIGTFTDSGKAVVKYDGRTIMDMDMDFLHEGNPKKTLTLKYTKTEHEEPKFEEPENLGETINNMLSRLNLCNKEYVSRQYDHEVQGGSVIKPLIGEDQDVHSKATVYRPLLDRIEGAAFSQGVSPSYGDIDTYDMAAAGIDMTVRRMISVGGSMDHMSLLDNFCWCSSDEPERLGQLERAARACYDMATTYGTPFISGKDSMHNDFKGFDKDNNPLKISVPPTLLFSGISKVDDVMKCITLDPKFEGDLVYVVGETKDETGGSEYLAMMGEELRGEKYIGNKVPKVDAEKFMGRYIAMEEVIDKGWVASCYPVGEGGLGTGFAEMAMAGNLGLDVRLSDVIRTNDVARDDTLLFSESQGRFIVTIDPQYKDMFEKVMEEYDISMVGKVRQDKNLMIKGIDGKNIVKENINTLKESYKKTMRW